MAFPLPEVITHLVGQQWLEARSAVAQEQSIVVADPENTEVEVESLPVLMLLVGAKMVEPLSVPVAPQVRPIKEH